MKGRVAILAGILVLTLAAGAAANPAVPMAGRGITVGQAQGEIGFDFALGLSKGLVAKEIWLGTQYLHDRHNGLSFRYGILDNLQLGAALSAMYWNNATGTEFGDGAYAAGEIYATWAFLDFLGVELGILIPGKNLSNNRVGVRLSIPFQYPLVENMLSVFVREDIVFKFINGGPCIDTFTDLGLTYNPINPLFIEFYAAFWHGISKSAVDKAIPLGIKIGGTPVPALDLALAFSFGDLRTQKADVRSVTLAAAYRF